MHFLFVCAALRTKTALFSFNFQCALNSFVLDHTYQNGWLLVNCSACVTVSSANVQKQKPYNFLCSTQR